jgi:16S rRNA (uracil1498-N3)-methyltransferase
VEKCTELGVKRLVFIQTDNTEKQSLNEERMRKVAIAALKQSQGSRLPIMETLPFSTVLGEAHESRLICHCRNDITIPTAGKETLTGDCLVLIGPEGDFTSKEVQTAATAGFSDYPLGTLILRTETACMAVAARYNG